MWLDERTAGPEEEPQVYHTAQGAYGWAFLFGLMGLLALLVGVAISTGLVKFEQPPSHDNLLGALYGGLNAALMSGAAGAWLFLEARNSRVILARDGLTAMNWRNLPRFFAWEDVAGILSWTTSNRKNGGSLALAVRQSAGRERWVTIARYYGFSSKALDTLREAIVARRGFTEVTPPLSAPARAALWLVGWGRQRTWR
jgi:hypothetical protein